MIGKAINGNSFKNCINYCLDKKKNPEVLGSSGLMITNKKKEIIKQFDAIRDLRPQVKKVVWHTPISFAHTDVVTNKLMRTIARDYIEEMELTNHQYMIVKHNDTKHAHMHLVINRIGFDSSVARDWKNSYRTMKVMQKLERKYDLTIALEQGNNKKELIKSAIEFGMSRKESFTVLMKRVEQLGYDVELNKTSNEVLRGVSFHDSKNGITYKASAIDRALSKKLKELHKAKVMKNQISR